MARTRIGIKIFFFIAIGLAALGMAAGAPVKAQGIDTTPTPTPVTFYQIQLSSGNWMTVNREITYGDVMVTVVILLFTVIFAVFGFIRVFGQWFTRSRKA